MACFGLRRGKKLEFLAKIFTLAECKSLSNVTSLNMLANQVSNLTWISYKPSSRKDYNNFLIWRSLMQFTLALHFYLHLFSWECSEHESKDIPLYHQHKLVSNSIYDVCLCEQWHEILISRKEALHWSSFIMNNVRHFW